LHRWRHVLALWILEHAQLQIPVIWLSIMNLHSVHVQPAPDLQIAKTTDCWNQTFPWIFVEVQLSLSTARGRKGLEMTRYKLQSVLSPSRWNNDTFPLSPPKLTPPLGGPYLSIQVRRWEKLWSRTELVSLLLGFPPYWWYSEWPPATM
jgi:hypothetical protein